MVTILRKALQSSDAGHSLDFINKAFECLDLIGWEHAATRADSDHVELSSQSGSYPQARK